MTEHLGTRLRAAVVARGGQQLRQALLAWDRAAGAGCVPRGGEAEARRALRMFITLLTSQRLMSGLQVCLCVCGTAL